MPFAAHSDRMDDDLAAIAEANGGYLMRGQLNDLGLTDEMIRARLRAGHLRRIRHGTYVVAPVWAVLSKTEKHVIITRSVLDKLGASVVASHQSAAAIHGLDLWGLDLSSVHVTRLDGLKGRREAGVVYHQGAVEPETEVQEVNGCLTVDPIRAAVETASWASVETGMVVLTSVMRIVGCDRDALRERASQFGHWPGMRRADLAIRLADRRLESVGEVRSLHMFWKFSVPAPELQHVVCDDHGHALARSDFYWHRFRHTGEFDGLIKYGRLNPKPDEPGRVLTDEKVREDRVREQLLGMSRWTWSDLAAPNQGRTIERIRADMERSRRLFVASPKRIA